MFVKQVELQEMFHVGHSHCTKVCRLIDARHDRYGDLPNLGSRYDVVCFADALANYRNLRDGLQVRGFDYDKVAKELPDEITRFNEDECKAQYDAGAERMKDTIFNTVWEWFNHTQPPDGQEDLMRAIRQGVLSQITRSEV